MKIKKITKIQNLGIFKDFSWNRSLPNFSEFNLIYGLNYSGKTTLSRIFDALGKPDLIPQLEGSFEVENGKGKILRSKDGFAPQNCRVFNRDFIDRNFPQEHNAPAVNIVGDDNVKIRDSISALEEELLQANRDKEKFETETHDWIIIVDLQLKFDEASAIGVLVSEKQINYHNFNQLIEKVKDSPDDHILEATEFSTLKAIARSSDEFEELNSFEIPNIDIPALVDEVSDLLGKTASKNAFEMSFDDVHHNTWIRNGCSFHSPGEECLFCGNMISKERFDQLKGHFATECESLVMAVQDKITELRNMEINFGIPANLQLVHTVRQEYSETISSIPAIVECANKIIPLLIDALEKKASGVKTKRKLPKSVYKAMANLTEYKYAAKRKRIAKLLKKHNKLIRDMDALKAKAKYKLKLHSAAQFYLDKNIAEEEEKYARIQADLAKAEKTVAELEAKIEEKKAEIKEHPISVKKLDKEIFNLLPMNNISAKQDSASEFLFRRGAVPAANLSDGERTAIAFAYFLLTLEESGNNLRNTLVFIDDPISSLDTNHIHAVYSVISSRLMGQCKQLFVSTHNHEFLNLFKFEAFKAKKTSKKSEGYLVERVKDQANTYAMLTEMPYELKQFKSEYQYLFALLYRLVFGKPTQHVAYTSSTALRKFLEIYLALKMPDDRKWSEKLDLLFGDDKDQCAEVAKFANEGSHSDCIEQAMGQREFIKSGKGIVKKVLKAIKKKDRSPYDTLKNVIKD